MALTVEYEPAREITMGFKFFDNSKWKILPDVLSARSRGGVIAVMYETHRTGLSRPSWKRVMGLQLSRHEILRSWAVTPNQHRQTNLRVRIGAAPRERFRSNGKRFLASGYGCVSHADWLRRYRTTVLPNGAYVWYKGDDGMWGLGKTSVTTPTDGVYLVRFWTTWHGSSFLFLRRATRHR